ncbi:hypothetical protein UXA24_11260 [Aeromonas caviae]|uniref:hypothetical protein n=1 Tax=Aeromonas caviae TaxID=648 RepID=UPI002AB3BEF4|nr:hypothetical protein [Aeromonas caviae]MDY7841548.1 hypothetical protein [Aeromonas caviae]
MDPVRNTPTEPTDVGKNNEKITATIQVEGILLDSDVGTWQANYQLTALEFEHIKNGKPVTFNWANSILLTVIGYGFSLAPRAVSKLTGAEKTISIANGEYITFLLGLGAAVVLYAIGLLMPNDRRAVMKSIQEHFKKSPKQRRMYKGS